MRISDWSSDVCSSDLASLLGTDALRDGVDVPGHSLRLVVMEGVPWSKPTVLHAARKLAGGGSAYDDRLNRARMAQAFGRLIRRAGEPGEVEGHSRDLSARGRCPLPSTGGSDGWGRAIGTGRYRCV